VWRDPSRPLTAAQQYLNLRNNPICEGSGILRPGMLTWRYQASPSPLSRMYDLRIEYRQGATPSVFVDAPDLTLLSDGRRLPHVYDQKPTSLCLYLPGTREWEPWLRLDQTIVPWSALWLFYFEEWLVSDHWKGGGAHPSPRERRGRRAAAQAPPAPAD
jgi:hypothetical protein